MLEPRKTKFRKQFRGRMKGKSARGTEIAFGKYALIAQTAGWISAAQIEAGRKVLTRFTRKGGRVWIRIFPDKPITDKPAQSSMGGGKGDVSEFVSVVKPGRVIFEIAGLDEILAKSAMKQASSKFSIKTKFLKKE